MSTHYRNPVYPGYLADPFVLRDPDEGGYVALGTGGLVDGRVFEVLTSPDLVTWTRVGGALEPLPEEHGTDYWAPEVAHRDGRWWLYYSVGVGDVGHRLRVAVADRAVGPYVDQGVDLTPDERFAIDPHPFRDEDGEWYLFYAHDDLEGPRVGTMLVVDRLVTPTRAAGEPVAVLRPSADWQLYARGRSMYGAVYDWHTLEGPTVVRRRGRLFLLYSGGAWTDATYGVGCAVAGHPLGPWQDVGAGPLLQTVPGHVVGPGHNSVVTRPGGDDVIVYHAWDAGRTARRMCIDALSWTPDGPVVHGPTWQDAELP